VAGLVGDNLLECQNISEPSAVFPVELIESIIACELKKRSRHNPNPCADESVLLFADHRQYLFRTEYLVGKKALRRATTMKKFTWCVGVIVWLMCQEGHAFGPAGHSLVRAVADGELEGAAVGNRASELLDVMTIEEAAMPINVEPIASL
jgi:hypothetical protein